MDTFVKTALAVAGLFLIVPLAVWAGTGSLRHAWHASKGYLTVMGILAAIGVGFSLISLVPLLFS